MKPFNFGAATITHDGVDIGYTNGGGSLTFKTIKETPISDNYGPIEYIIGGDGTIHLYKPSSSSFSASDNVEASLYSYGELIFNTALGEVTLHKAKIHWPESITLGINSQKSFNVRISFTGNSNNKVITIKGDV